MSNSNNSNPIPSKESIDSAIKYGLQKLGYENNMTLKEKQKEAVHSFAEGNDVLVVLPTGYGKSLCFFLLPFIFDFIRSKVNSIIIVISPLKWLIQDQLSALVRKNIYAINLAEYHKGISLEGVKFIYTTPETLLGFQKNLLCEPYIRNNLVGFAIDEAHCVINWGDSFRRDYGALKCAFRKLPSVQKIALTATASPSTIQKIGSRLILGPKYAKVMSLEQRNNIKLGFRSASTLSAFLNTLLDELITARPEAIKKTVIFCTKLEDSTDVYQFFKFYTMDNQSLWKNFQLYTSCTEDGLKMTIAKDFIEKDSNIRILVATSAFGMGVDAKGIERVIHVFPPLYLDDYVQQIGRAGRGDEQVEAILFYALKNEDKPKEMQIRNVTSPEMRRFIMHDGCKRKLIAKYYGFRSEIIEPTKCCDFCLNEKNNN